MKAVLKTGLFYAGLSYSKHLYLKHIVKPVLNSHSQNDQKLGFQDQISLFTSEVLQNSLLGAFCNIFDLH